MEPFEMIGMIALHFWWALVPPIVIIAFAAHGFRESKRANRLLRLLALATVAFGLLIFLDKAYIVEVRPKKILVQIGELGTAVKTSVKSDAFTDRFMQLHEDADDEFHRLRGERERVRKNSVLFIFGFGLCAALGSRYFQEKSETSAP